MTNNMTNLPRPASRTIFDRIPPEKVKDLADLAVEHPDYKAEDLAEESGIPPGIVRELFRTSRFGVIVARRAADRMAIESVPKAVKVLNSLMDGSYGAPASVRLGAAQTVLTHVKPYLDGHADRAKEEADIAEMTQEELLETIRRSEEQLAASARDITPVDAQNSPKGGVGGGESVLD